MRNARQYIVVLSLFLISAIIIGPGCSSGGGDGTSPVVYPWTIKLAKTGQNNCYDETGVIIPCTDTGQDGELQHGAAWPDPRFIDNGDGTITDRLTGLMWLKDANCLASQYPVFDNDGTAGDGVITWQHALDFIVSINTGTYANCGAGHADWRLPNRTELKSLADYSQTGPALQAGHPFTNAGTHPGYWSSTTYAPAKDIAWIFNFVTGGVDYNNKINGNYAVWPVRGSSTSLSKTGQTTCYDQDGALRACTGTGEDGEHQSGLSWPSPRFTDHADGTMTDKLTGLMWLQDANCMASNYAGFDIYAPNGDGDVNWQLALAFVASINTGTSSLCGAGHTDWRLPNTSELESIIDSGSDTGLGWLSAEGFINVQTSWNRYWTSTTAMFAPSNAHMVIGLGHHLYLPKAIPGNPVYVWPVRNAL